jgi:F-type H+-transporting ATPase subunit b
VIVWQAANFGLLESEPKGFIERAIAFIKHLPEAVQGFIEKLPAPMQLNWRELLFVVLLVTILYFFLKATFFKPLVAVMDQREKDMSAGAEAKALALAMIEQRQAEYQAKLRDLRNQAFSHRKNLAEAASKEKQALLDQTRTKAQAQREESLALLKSQAAAASTELMAQVDVLAESMAQHLLQQA